MTNTVFVYNSYTDSWDIAPSMPSPKAETQGVTEMHSTNIIHVVSGGMSGFSAGTDHYAFMCPVIGYRDYWKS